jgi:hypothetical protein
MKGLLLQKDIQNIFVITVIEHEKNRIKIHNIMIVNKQ